MAEFLVLTADPLQTIANVQKIEAVVRGGHRFDEKDLIAR